MGRGCWFFFPFGEYPGVVFANTSPHVALRPKLVLSQQCPIVRQDGSGWVYVLTKPEKAIICEVMCDGVEKRNEEICVLKTYAFDTYEWSTTCRIKTVCVFGSEVCGVCVCMGVLTGEGNFTFFEAFSPKTEIPNLWKREGFY